MGTNYYYERASKGPCPECGHEDEAPRLHIGKSSAGWVFALHVIPEEGLNTLDDWEALWNRPGGQIRNEYGDHVAPESMQSIIRERHARFPGVSLRRDADTSKHGSGSWDLHAGEFS